MEKTNGKEAFALSTVETGIENPGLKLTVTHQFSFCTSLWTAAWPHVGYLTALNPFHPWQGLMTDLSSTSAYRKKG